MFKKSAFWLFSSKSHKIIAPVTSGSQSQEKKEKKKVDFFLFALSNFFNIAKSFTLAKGNTVRQEQVLWWPVASQSLAIVFPNLLNSRITFFGYFAFLASNIVL